MLNEFSFSITRKAINAAVEKSSQNVLQITRIRFEERSHNSEAAELCAVRQLQNEQWYDYCCLPLSHFELHNGVLPVEWIRHPLGDVYLHRSNEQIPLEFEQQPFRMLCGTPVLVSRILQLSAQIDSIEGPLRASRRIRVARISSVCTTTYAPMSCCSGSSCCPT